VSERGTSGLWVIALTFLLAFLLAVMPLPAWLIWARPEWIALVLIYWVVALPQRVGVLVAFVLGVLVDILEGAVMGQNALSLSVVAFLALILYQRVRVFNLWQQGAVVFMLLGINQLLVQWVQNITSQGAQTLFFLMPALMGALLWPGVFILLRQLRRRYRVS
jgi:rod shape-determining protein MreD